MNRSFLFECREAARNCRDVLLAKLLRDATDNLAVALGGLAESPTTSNMQAAVAAWTRAAKAKEKALPLPDPAPPRAGAGEIERERMAA